MMTGISAVNFNTARPHFAGRADVERTIVATLADHGRIKETKIVPARGSRPERTAYTILNGKPTRGPLTIVVPNFAVAPSALQLAAIKAYAGVEETPAAPAGPLRHTAEETRSSQAEGRKRRVHA
jgi:hypothetical protein